MAVMVAVAVAGIMRAAVQAAVAAAKARADASALLNRLGSPSNNRHIICRSRLAANSVCLRRKCRLTHRIRQQAGSYG